jgi:hypothetical protein
MPSDMEAKDIIDLPRKYRITLYFIAATQFINLAVTVAQAVHK